MGNFPILGVSLGAPDENSVWDQPATAKFPVPTNRVIFAPKRVFETAHHDFAPNLMRFALPLAGAIDTRTIVERLTERSGS
jgi:hypothetical protein